MSNDRMNPRRLAKRPAGITAIAGVFAFGVLASGVALVTLAVPGGALDLVWRVNPRGHASFVQMGIWAFPLLGAVFLACASTAFGLMTGRKWGYRAAVFMLLMNLLGSVVNTLAGDEPRAIVGVPIVALILWYLSTPAVRTYFFRPSSEAR
jgi:hypothetical protein